MGLTNLHLLELKAIAELQLLTWLQPVMVLVSEYTNEFAWILIPFTFFLVGDHIGRGLAVTYFAADAATHLLKLFFQQPRPFWLSDEVHSLGPSSGFGMPSGHVMLISAVLFFLAAAKRSRTLWYAAAGCSLTVGISRIYLGVHFGIDVIGGAFFALVIALGLNRVRTLTLENQVTSERAMIIASLSGLSGAGYLVTIGATSFLSNHEWEQFYRGGAFHWKDILPAISALFTIAFFARTDDYLMAVKEALALRWVSLLYCLLGLYLIVIVFHLPVLHTVGVDSAYISSLKASLSMLWIINIMPFLRNKAGASFSRYVNEVKSEASF